MKTLKLIAFILILVLGVGAGIYLANNIDFLNNKTEKINITSTIKQILPVSEYVSIVYHYTDVITHSDAIPFFNWGNIPFTEKKSIYTIDGTVKLGFNGEKINIKHSRDTITIQMPAIEIISHEIFPDTFNLYDEKSGLFNRYTLTDAYSLQLVQRLEREKKINENENLFAQARTSAEQQFKRLLESLPGIKDNYSIVFEWDM
ncbi:MAG: DUF4230 domain-containing protein [Treponema sp.]|nr:DUF4230 domain-containing protein [Treponema sp.]